MPTRRDLIAGAGLTAAAGITGLAGLAGGSRGARAEEPAGAAFRTEDGLYRQPWFLESFLELGPDLEDAAAAGKRLAVMWELRGCPACRDVHLVNFAVPAVTDYIRERFAILQLNVIGALDVVDFDGETLSEKALAAKYGVRGTPTIQFFPPGPEGLAARAPREREVFRIVGYHEPEAFRRMFAYVAEDAYREMPVQEWLRG
ncbi:thioredoxin family protein [Salinarimonas rosea]|uniref:thioredoxin family protein n=1 Tax=Salinarimonas rosea TaxID=552063 RepID=UPI000411C439|nr:thioredoxin family protein [Salinarimonas rosea]